METMDISAAVFCHSIFTHLCILVQSAMTAVGSSLIKLRSTRTINKTSDLDNLEKWFSKVRVARAAFFPFWLSH